MFNIYSWPRWAVVLLCFFGVIIQSVLYARAWNLDDVRDFTGFYVGSRLVGTPQLYDPGANLEIQRSLGLTPIDSVIFVRLPYFAFLIKPIALFSYRGAFLLWRAFLLAALAIFAIIFPFGTVRLRWLSLCWFFPASQAVVMGQDSPFVILWIAIALRLRAASAFFAAGVVLSLTAEKWHLLAFLPLLLLLRREWKIFSGFAAGWAAILASCFMIQGPDFLRQYYEALTIPNMNAIGTIMPNFLGLTKIVHAPLALYFVCSAFAIYAFVRSARAGCFEGAFAIMLLLGITVAPHGYCSDWTVVLPGLLLIAAKQSQIWPIPALSASAAPLIFFLFPVGALLMVLISIALFATQVRRPLLPPNQCAMP